MGTFFWRIGLEQKSSKSILIAIFFTILIDMIGIGILIPIFPMLVVHGSINRIIPLDWSDAQGFMLIGWLLTCFPLAQFICAPILGQLSDRYGRKRVLAISLFGTSISYAVFAIAIATKNIPLMFFSRIIDGATGGNIAVAQAVIGDISAPKDRAKNFGMIGMSFGIGFILGPFLGGKLADPSLVSWFNIATPFWFAAILGMLNVLLIIFNLPETLKVRSDKRIDLHKPIHNIVKGFSLPGIRSIIPATFLWNLGFTFYTTFFGIVLAEKFGFNQGHIGNFFAYMGIMIVFVQGVIVRRLSGKVEEYKVLRFSIIGSGVCVAMYYFVPLSHSGLLYMIPPFMALCNAMSMSFSSALLTKNSPANIRGEVMGINSSANALAQALPGVMAGYIATSHAGLPILVGGLIIICAGLLFWVIYKPLK